MTGLGHQLLFWVCTAVSIVLGNRPVSAEHQLCLDQHSYDSRKKIQLLDQPGAKDDKPLSKSKSPLQSISTFNTYMWKNAVNHIFMSGVRALKSGSVIFESFRRKISSFKEQPGNHTDTEPRKPMSLGRERPLELSKPHKFDQYSLTNTGNTKRRTFFAYNTRNRVGAEEEANNLRQRLEALSFEITESLVNFGAEELLDGLERFCKENAKTTSILVVVILSHGSWGRVHDKDDRWIDINEIQEPMTIIPHKIPKVLIIQACQGGSVQEHCKCASYDSGPPRGRLGSSDIHIQDLDMAILMSTLWGQMSTRNFFISILCEVLKEATIKPLEFTEIFRRVCTIMTQRNRSNYFSTSLDHKRERESTSKLTSPTETNIDNHQHEATPNLCPPEDTGFEDTGFEDTSLEEEFIQIPCMLSTLRKKLFFDRFSSDSAIF